MITISIPGWRELRLAHLVLDYNGTLACDGRLIEGVSPLLVVLAAQLEVHIVTAETFGSVEKMFAGTRYQIFKLPTGNEEQGKLQYVRNLGVESVVCNGNGRNDRLMLKAAALGVAVQQREGLALDALLAADLVTPGIVDALELLLYPLRLVATLRC
jgi:soluble P-type ATPase